MLRTCLLAILFVACHSTRDQHYRVFVSNEADDTVSVIDGATRAITAQIPVGKRPRGLHVSRDGSTLYVALSGSPRGGPGIDESTLPAPDRAADGIGVVDLRTLALVRTISSGTDPESFDLVDGTTLVVSNEDAAQASIVDVATGAVRAHVPVGREPEGVTTAPDGGLVYVTSEGDAHVTAIDPHTASIVATIATGQRPRALAFTRDGVLGLVTGEADRSVTVIDAASHVVRARIEIPAGGSGPGGPRPMGIAIPGDRFAYVTTGRGGSIAEVDIASLRVSRVFPEIGARPWGIAVAPDGMLYTANGSSNDVSMVDPDSGRVLSRIRCGASPWGIAVQHL